MARPPLDESIAELQPGHLLDHDYIAKVLNVDGLDPVSLLTGAETVFVMDGGEPKRTTAADIAGLGGGGGGGSAALITAGSDQKVLRDWFPWTKRSRFNVPGATGADDNARVAATIAQAGSYALTAGGADIVFPDGDYIISPKQFPHQANLIGAGKNRTRIATSSTTNQNFLYHYGSKVTIAGLTIDGRRANQTVSSAGHALQVVKPNGTTGGAVQVSGGLLLTAGPSAGATSITVSVASVTDGNGRVVPVMPGDFISFNNGSHFELARVARTYTGGTTIPLQNPLQFSWTTGAWLSFASTDVTIEDCDIFAVGFFALSLWHTINCNVNNVRAYDAIDTCIDIEGGCMFVNLTDCFMETNGRWSSVVDAGDTKYGSPREITYRDCHARVLSGGVDPDSAGVAFSGFDIHDSEDVKIIGGSTDIRLAGGAGIRRKSASDDGARRFKLLNHTIIGPPAGRSGSRGYQSILQDNSNPADAEVCGCTISDVEIGIEFDTDRAGTAIGNTILNTTYAINMTANGVGVQTLRSAFNKIDNTAVGVRGGGTATAGSTVHSVKDTIRTASFAPISGDTNWVIDSDSTDGWVGVTLPTNWIGTLRYKLVGGVMHIEIDASNNTGSSATFSLAAGTLPSPLRPALTHESAGQGVLVVTTGGAISSDAAIPNAGVFRADMAYPL